MRGEVLKPDDADGPGVITGSDGKRYHFITARVHKGALLAPGAAVDFIALGEDARDIYELAAKAPEPAAPYVPVYSAPAGPANADSLLKYFQRTLSVNYFQFNGRARRAEYWGFVLFQVIALIVLFIVDAVITGLFFGAASAEDYVFLPILSGLFYLYCIIPSIAIAVRRLHDRDVSGWLYLINIIPYIGGIVLFVLMCLDSTPPANKHGKSPKYGGLQSVDAFD